MAETNLHDNLNGEEQYEEMDLTPYEEDDDATLHRKLVAAKMARKKAEDDLKLLCNRIGLLKQEEGKVSKNWIESSRQFAKLKKLESGPVISSPRKNATTKTTNKGS